MAAGQLMYVGSLRKVLPGLRFTCWSLTCCSFLQAPESALPSQPIMLDPDWAFNVTGVVHAVRRFTDAIAAEAKYAEHCRAAALEEQRIAAARRQDEEHHARAEQAAEQARKQQAAVEEQRLAEEADRQRHQAEADAAEQRRQAVEQLQAEQARADAAAAVAAAEATAAAEQEALVATAATPMAAATPPPLKLSPMEGVPEGHATALQVRLVRVPAATPTCIEGVPELCMSAWRGPDPHGDTSSDEAPEADKSVASLTATPPMLSTGLAGAAEQVALDLARQQDMLKWPSMRPTSIGAHPSRTPALDAVPVPAHPILVPSPPEAQPGACEARTSQAGASQTGASQAGASQAGASQAGASQAGASQAGASQAGASQAGASQAGASQAGASQASASQAEPDAAQDASPEGSISLHGGVSEGDGTGAQQEQHSEAWYMQATGDTPAGHANAACSAHFSFDEDSQMEESPGVAGPSRAAPPSPAAGVHGCKRARSPSLQDDLPGMPQDGEQQVEQGDWPVMDPGDFGGDEEFYGCAVVDTFQAQCNSIVQ